MKTQLTFGAVHITRLSLMQTHLSIRATAPPPRTLTLLNIGVPGPAGRGIDDFDIDLALIYQTGKL